MAKLTRIEAIQRIILNITAGQPNHPLLVQEPEIDLLLDLTVHEFATRFAKDIERRGQLSQNYSVTLDANGQGNLLTAVGSITAAADYLLEDIILSPVLDTSDLQSDGIGRELVYVPQFNEFRNMPTDAQFGWYGLYTTVNQRIYTRQFGQTTGCVGPLILYGVFVPTISNTAANTTIPELFSDEFVRLATELYLSRLPKAIPNSTKAKE